MSVVSVLHQLPPAPKAIVKLLKILLSIGSTQGAISTHIATYGRYLLRMSYELTWKWK